MRKISKDAFVVIGHCPKERGIYGITVDRVRQGQYSFVWAFPLNKERAKHEGFDVKSVHGSVTDDAEYPGCPYCDTKNKVICSCGAAICHHGEKIITCPNCGLRSEVTYAESFNLKGGSM